MVWFQLVEEMGFSAVQPTVQAHAESLGIAGRRWLDSLPCAIAHQCRQWSLQWIGALPGGSRSYVSRVTTSQGQQAVLKLALPEPGLERQIETLVAAKGRGYVQVLAHDIDTGALLMESLGQPVDEYTQEVSAVLMLTAKTLEQAWQVDTDGFFSMLDSREHKAASLLTLVGDLATGREVHAVVTQALAYAHNRYEAKDVTRQVLVHGDPHAQNLLRVQCSRPGAETGFVFVDPEGFLCEPEYDLGVAVRGWNAQLMASANPQSELRAWCETLATATATEAEAIWQWAYLERVSTGLYLTHHGLPDLGAPYLRVAERLID
jgi:streptomycin 6-kinase